MSGATCERCLGTGKDPVRGHHPKISTPCINCGGRCSVQFGSFTTTQLDGFAQAQPTPEQLVSVDFEGLTTSQIGGQLYPHPFDTAPTQQPVYRQFRVISADDELSNIAILCELIDPMPDGVRGRVLAYLTTRFGT